MFAGKRFSLVVLLVVTLVGASFGSVAGAADAPCAQPHDAQPTDTFEVRARVERDVYALGDVAIFRVKVTRTIDGHEVGPAEDADVGVTATIGDELVAWGGNTTDADGKATIKARVRRHAPTGYADVYVWAVKGTADLPCHWTFEREFGDAELRDLFAVVP